MGVAICQPEMTKNAIDRCDVGRYQTGSKKYFASQSGEQDRHHGALLREQEIAKMPPERGIKLFVGEIPGAVHIQGRFSASLRLRRVSAALLPGVHARQRSGMVRSCPENAGHLWAQPRWGSSPPPTAARHSSGDRKAFPCLIARPCCHRCSGGDADAGYPSRKETRPAPSPTARQPWRHAFEARPTRDRRPILQNTCLQGRDEVHLACIGNYRAPYGDKTTMTEVFAPPAREITIVESVEPESAATT
jgi:hypothetical protein